MYLWPAYGGNNTPYGKGLDYLSRCEAKTVEDLARSQLSALRLLGLATLWGVTLFGFEGVIYGDGNRLTALLGGRTLGIPALGDLVQTGATAPRAAAWTSVYCELMKQVLRHAAGSHGIIAILRLFGFNVFRSTYKPLLAESVVEFWNRFYYYFKELLVTFFMPTFAGFGRRLRRWPSLRLFVAVFAAAFVGNMYYHWLRLAVPLAQGEVFDSLYSLRSRMFYCLLLAFGIFVSMLREQRRLGRDRLPGGPRRVLRILGVWTFFALILDLGRARRRAVPRAQQFLSRPVRPCMKPQLPCSAIPPERIRHKAGASRACNHGQLNGSRNESRTGLRDQVEDARRRRKAVRIEAARAEVDPVGVLEVDDDLHQRQRIDEARRDETLVIAELRERLARFLQRAQEPVQVLAPSLPVAVRGLGGPAPFIASVPLPAAARGRAPAVRGTPPARHRG